MAVTLLLILLMIAGSFAVVHWVSYHAEQECFDRLSEEANQLAHDIELHAESDQEQLSLLATVVVQYADDFSDPALWNILDSYQSVGMMSRLELLLPDNTIVTTAGRRFDGTGALSFAQVAQQGAHISKQATDWDGAYIIRHFFPVYKNEEIVAMLYGVVQLGTLPDILVDSPYSGQASVYIIEGSTGNLLVDTWHSTPGSNLWEMGTREMAPGYDYEQLKQDTINGETGYVVFVSKTIGEYLYYYFMPMEINDWRLALSVPESVVFSSAQDAREKLRIFVLFESVCAILYFLWTLRYMRRELSQRQRQFDTLNYIYDVEKLLFNAHEKQENMAMALDRIARITTAEGVKFRVLRPSEMDICFLWSKDQSGYSPEVAARPLGVTSMLSYFHSGHDRLASYDAQHLRQFVSDAEQKDISNLLAIAVDDIDGNICGILSTFNMREHADPAMLKSVSFSFSMFCHNMQSYYAIKEQGERDLLSGLYNRNRYEMELPNYLHQYHSSLACIYVDLNGLHELNNTQGHAAGDAHLQAVASSIRKQFGAQHAYRIGGDEFVVFVIDREQADVLQMTQALTQELAEQDISISTGMHWERVVHSMAELTGTAEKHMYAAKKAHYEQMPYDRRNRKPR